MKKYILMCSAAAMLPTSAYAQSTGTVETEKDTIVITGSRANRGVAGVVVQDSTKAKGLITSELIQKQSPGQTLISNINFVPGANFTQSDSYGGAGGNIRIRGFDGNRVSLTFDGVPLNDSGNYAIYSSQMLDPELVEQVNVNLGATDVDSPTASAAGGTINFRSIIPTDDMGARLAASIGTDQYRRVFGLVQSGSFGPLGTKAWLAASRTTYDHWRGPGEIKKWQVNARVYQELGSAGDFVSLAGHYNQQRNNNYNNPDLSNLRTFFTNAVVPDTLGADGFVTVGDYNSAQWKKIDSLAYIESCRDSSGNVITRAAPGAGAQNDPTSCQTPEGPLASQNSTNLVALQINPSNTGNIRGNSRFTLGDGLILTVDPTYQYVLANGGTQSTTMTEGTDRLLRSFAGSTSGFDLNGDGDTADRLLVGRPSITNTNRITVINSLVWKINPQNTFRVAYTFDRAHHRQTGEYTLTDNNFGLADPFFGRNGTPILNSDGDVLQNRDRTSIALLNQLAAQYIGKFVDNRLRVEIGVRAPWFTRKLDQHCYTPVTGSGFPVCADDPASGGYNIVENDIDPATAGSSDVYAPFKATYKYSKVLPNLGATFALTDALSLFGSYAKGFSAPRTDNLYRQPFIGVRPETTNSYDLGVRFINGRVQAQSTLWKIDYANRIVQTFDPETLQSIDRNVGKVKSWGVDSSLGFRPTREINLLGLLSYTNAKLQEDIQVGRTSYNPASPPTLIGTQYICDAIPTTTANVNVCARTTGKFVVETPKWQYGLRAEGNFGGLNLGIQAKHVGDRWVTDVNDVKTAGYTLVDADVRIGLPKIANGKSYVQFNVNNLLNERYFGNISTQINAFGTGALNPRFTPGAPRSATASLNIGL